MIFGSSKQGDLILMYVPINENKGIYLRMTCYILLIFNGIETL
jgi:hypothetical protein